MVRLVTAVVCEAITETPPHTLVRVCKRWRFPPPSIFIYLEIVNISGDSFDVSFELWRRGEKVDYTAPELVLHTMRDVIEVWSEYDLPPLDAKAYELRVLLNGLVTDTLYVDFGHPKGLL